MKDIQIIEKGVYTLLEDQLASDLTYHSIAHTQDVVRQALHLAQIYKIPARQRLLLHIAALYHDTGFISSYSGHEEESIQIFRSSFPNGKISESEKNLVDGMIRATRIPQQPNNFLEKIIADADLDYLGRSDFYTTGNLLYQEFLTYGVVSSEEEWNKVQVSFLSSHEYHTGYSQLYRSCHKAQRLQELRQKTEPSG